MTVSDVVRPLAIVGCGAVTPAGVGPAALAELVASGKPGHSSPPLEYDKQYPPRPLRTVPELRLSEHVANKKNRRTRHLDRMTAMALIACEQALEDSGTVPGPCGEPPAGVILGTSTGSIQSVAELAHDTLTQSRPYLVNPARFPNTVMNAAAGQIAIWNSLRGVNATLAGGLLSSIFALRCARLMIYSGRATRLVVGGIEELSPFIAWGWHRTNAISSHVPLGEGCAALVLDAAADDTASAAELLACEVRFCGTRPVRRADLISGLSTCIERALVRSGAAPGDIDAVWLGSAGFEGLERAERRAIRNAIGRFPHELRITETVGAAYSATSALQVVAQLGLWRIGSPHRLVLVTALGPDGNVGCALVRQS